MGSTGAGRHGFPGLVVVGTWDRAVNPYPRMLYDELDRNGIHVARTAHRHAEWPKRQSDQLVVAHLHWLGGPFKPRSSIRAALLALRLLCELFLWRMRGGRIVWTRHNELSHDTQHPLLERLALRFLMEVLFDRIIVMTDSEASAVRDVVSRRARSKIRLVPHPTYESIYGQPISKSAARSTIGLPHDVTLLLSFGRIEPYKGITELLMAFRQVDDPAFLAVVGNCADPTLRVEIEELASNDPRVRLHLERVPESEVSAWVCASDWIVLSHREVMNSGVALLAQTYARPVIAPRAGALPEVLGEEGEGVVMYEPGSGLIDALKSAVTTPPPTVSPKTVSAKTVAELLAEIYRELLPAGP